MNEAHYSDIGHASTAMKYVEVCVDIYNKGNKSSELCDETVTLSYNQRIAALVNVHAYLRSR